MLFRSGPLRPYHTPSLLAEALEVLAPVLGPVHRDDDGDPARPLSLELVAPLVAVDAVGRRPTAIMVLRLDPALALYPTIQEWPGRGGTAEVQLAERRGDEMVFLTDLHNRPTPPLQGRVPMSERETLVVQAAAGARGLLEGIDYRIAIITPGRDLTPRFT